MVDQSPRPVIDLSVRRGPLTELTQAEVETNRTLSRQIAEIAAVNLGGKRFQVLSEGHLRTYSIGEENRYDHVRRLSVQDLVISIEDTRSSRGLDGEILEKSGAVRIGVFDLTRIHRVEKLHYTDGGIGITTTSSPARQKELEEVLDVLNNGSIRDSRSASWREMVTSALS